MRQILLVAIFLFSSLRGESLKLVLAAEEAILMNAKTGKILFEKEAHKAAYPASTTKIATALMVLAKSRQDLKKILTADREALASISPQAKKQSNYRSPPHWLETDSTHIGIKKGEELSIEELLHAVLIASANDASNVLAQGLGPSIPLFMAETNAYLKKIGCKHTNFNNPSGLHHPSHVTTAYDLAIMAKEGLKDPIFRKIVAKNRHVCARTNVEEERLFSTTNHLLKNGPYHYSKAIGIKTGTTQAAGKNLVAAAQDGDRILIAVALGYRGLRGELYQDVIKMFETAFNEKKMRRVFLQKGEQKITTRVSGARKALKTYLSESLAYEYYPSEEVQVKISVSWKIPHFPIKKGDCVGKVSILDEEGQIFQTRSLLALNDLNPTLWYQLTHLFSKDAKPNNQLRRLIFCSAAALLSLALWKFRKKRVR